MSVRIVLAEGFAGETVELTVDGRPHIVAAARTAALTGMADELVVAADAGPVQVSARLGTQSDPGGPAYLVPPGATLVLDRTADGLKGRVHTGPVGFA